jgi:hypothetical protein
MDIFFHESSDGWKLPFSRISSSTKPTSGKFQSVSPSTKNSINRPVLDRQPGHTVAVAGIVGHHRESRRPRVRGDEQIHRAYRRPCHLQMSAAHIFTFCLASFRQASFRHPLIFCVTSFSGEKGHPSHPSGISCSWQRATAAATCLRTTRRESPNADFSRVCASVFLCNRACLGLPEWQQRALESLPKIPRATASHRAMMRQINCQANSA